MKSRSRSFRVLPMLLFLALTAGSLYSLARTRSVPTHNQELTVSQFLVSLREDRVKSASLTGNEVSGQMNSGVRYRVALPGERTDEYEAVYKGLGSQSVDWQIEPSPSYPAVVSLLAALAVPLAAFLILGVLVFAVLRSTQTAGSKPRFGQ